MKIKIRSMKAFYALTTGLIIFLSCQKNDNLSTNDISTSSTIAVAVSATSTTTVAAGGTDSIYLVQPCGRGGRRDSISQSGLPANVATYLTANYSDYTFYKAFAIKNSSSQVTGYAVVIYFNNKPVGLQFDNAGAFVKVLEQREKGDLSGSGHHRGGRFEHRDGLGRDSVAVTALPSSVASYFATNYPTDTLLKAFKNIDSSIVVVSKNNGAFATTFSASGAFIKRNSLNSRGGNCQSIELAALPSMAANYLAQTYPNYVFKKAFAIIQNGTAKGFIVFIDANNTKYAVEFDTTGNFVAAKTIE
jgi:hypothetical protein